MSRFSESLASLMRQHEPPLRQIDLEGTTGIHNSLISRVLSGTKHPTEDQVARLCAAISPDPATRAQLLVAYLRDVAAPTLAQADLDARHVIIRVAGEHESLAEPDWFASAPTGLVCMLELIGRAALERPAVERLVEAITDQVAPLRLAPNAPGKATGQAQQQSTTPPRVGGASSDTPPRG